VRQPQVYTEVQRVGFHDGKGRPVNEGLSWEEEAVGIDYLLLALPMLGNRYERQILHQAF
jgi:hypothetical protein